MKKRDMKESLWEDPNKFSQYIDCEDGIRGYVLQRPPSISPALQRLIFGDAVQRPFTSNGYVKFPFKPVTEDGYGGILSYVPVHGGITFARQFADGFVYGFDTAHSGDDSRREVADDTWLKNQVLGMAHGIRVAAKYEQEFLTSPESDLPDLIQRFRDEAGATDSDHLGINALLRLVTGNLR